MTRDECEKLITATPLWLEYRRWKEAYGDRLDQMTVGQLCDAEEQRWLRQLLDAVEYLK